MKANAKSGSGRNEEYYGKIEDDNRRNHVEFRSEILTEERKVFYQENIQEEIPRPLPQGVAGQTGGDRGECVQQVYLL